MGGLGALLLVILLAFLPHRSASAASRISWLTTDLPPIFIYYGSQRGQGAGDQEIDYLQHHLPGFDHRLVPASYTRLWYEIGHADGICSVASLRTPEREKIALFSKRASLIPSYKLIIRSADRKNYTPFLNKDGAVELDRLAGRTDLSGAYTAGRHHTVVIDDFLRREDQQQRLQALTSPLQIFNLLFLGRIDFIFSDLWEVPFYRQEYNYSTELVGLPVAGSPAWIYPYVTCSKGPLGQRVIAAVDKLLDNDQSWAEFIAPFKKLLSPEEFQAMLSSRSDP